jgi:hypothetical protein
MNEINALVDIFFFIAGWIVGKTVAVISTSRREYRLMLREKALDLAHSAWCEAMVRDLRGRTPERIGDLVHKALIVANEVNPTDGSDLFLTRTDWTAVGAYLIKLEQDAPQG